MDQKIRVVLIGGPASGKTTLMNEFISSDYTLHPEISREVTRRAMEDGIDQLFLTDPLVFSKQLLEGRIQQFQDAAAGINIYDRGIPDVPAYHVFTGDDLPYSLTKPARDYKYDKIFFLPAWKEIYQQDSERYESWKQAVEIEQILKEYYTDLDYELIEVPYGSPSERAMFVKDRLIL